ncbi:BLUF domain-containing protein [Bradyrhizobium sp. McL0616]
MLAGVRQRNAAADLTGMLVFAQNRFLQVLEGRAEDVLATFARIEIDRPA